MGPDKPTLEQWKGLYSAAIGFRDIESWRWMSDAYPLGVQNPDTGEIGYGCIMGQLGQCFGLVVYLGSGGLQIYEKLRSGEMQPEDPDLAYVQHCLVASFEDRRALQKPDLEIIKQLGLKFRGAHVWPLFRSYRPGYYPWYLEPAEVQFLTEALEQARIVALRCKDDPDLLTPPPAARGKYFVRVPERHQGSIQWRDDWRKPAPIPSPPLPAEPPDEIQLQRLKQRARRWPGIWELDVFYGPMTIKEKGDERPYFPPVLLCVEQRSGMILSFHLFKPSEYPARAAEQFLAMLTQTEIIPQEIWIQRAEILAWLSPLAAYLNIQLTRAHRLRVADHARRAMGEYFGR